MPAPMLPTLPSVVDLLTWAVAVGAVASLGFLAVTIWTFVGGFARLRVVPLLAAGHLRDWTQAGASALEAPAWVRAGLTASDYYAWRRFSPLLGGKDHAEHIAAAIRAGYTPDDARTLPGGYVASCYFGPAFAAGLTIEDIDRLHLAAVEPQTLLVTVHAVDPARSGAHRTEILAWAVQPEVAATPVASGSGLKRLPTPKDATTMIRRWREAVGADAHLFAAAGFTLDEALAAQAASTEVDLLDGVRAMASLRSQ